MLPYILRPPGGDVSSTHLGQICVGSDVPVTVRDGCARQSRAATRALRHGCPWLRQLERFLPSLSRLASEPLTPPGAFIGSNHV